MIKVIGNAELSFEITDEFFKEKLACIRMIINGNKIGTLQSPTYLPSFIGALNSILNSDYFFNYGINTSNYKSFFMEGNNITNLYRVTFEETFDDYEKRVIRNEDFVFFYFNHLNNRFFNYDVIQKKIFEFVSINNYKDALLQLNNYINLHNE